MNKDALLATIIGFAVGLLLAGAVLMGPKLIAQIPNIKIPFLNSTPKANTDQSNPTADTATTAEHALTIESPLADSISDTNSLIISGSTTAESVVVVAGLSDEDVATVGADGKYTGKIALQEGKNDIVITSFLSGKPVNKTVTVFYSSVKL